jgi:hypothetical protein
MMKAAYLAGMAVVCASLAALPSLATAGQNCDAKPMQLKRFDTALNLAAATERQLNADNVKVVLLARAGTDLTEYKLEYSHLGFAYKLPDNTWRVLHKLNECGTAVSGIFKHGLAEFYADDLFQPIGAYVSFKPEIEAKLLPKLLNWQGSDPIFAAPYSMVSYAWGQKYQQSNQWAIETMASTLGNNINTRQQAQDWLRSNGYQPSKLTIRALKRAGARMSSANIAFDDHPNEQRFADIIETITVDSVYSWLQNTNRQGIKRVIDQQSQVKSPPTQIVAPAAAAPTKPVTPAPQSTTSSPTKANEAREANAIAISMMAQMCMGAYPETRPIILKRFRQDIEKVAGKDIAAKVLDKRFEEDLKELLASTTPKTVFFSDPFYPTCSSFIPELILTDDREKETLQGQADERLQYVHEILEQCKKRYPGRTLGAAQDRQKELDSYFGPRIGATAFNDYGHAYWIKGSVKNSEATQSKVAERIRQHGESGWQARCKPQ